MNNESTDVWIETKGYSSASDFLSEYKSFICKSFVLWNSYSRYNKDIFWFVTNVPFGNTHGKSLIKQESIKASIKENIKLYSEDNVSEELLSQYSLDFQKRIYLIILTDSYIKLFGIEKQIEKGDTIFKIWQSIGRQSSFTGRIFYF